MTERIGKQLGNYRLVRVLGSGGFATVFLGEHVHLGTPAVLKVRKRRYHGENLANYLIQRKKRGP